MVDYNNFAKTFAESRKNLKWPEIEYFFQKFDLNGKKILDIGCGSGRLLEFIKGNFKDFQYTGVDLSSELIKIAKENNPENDFRVLSMEKIDELGSQNYDFVFFIASFHHLNNLEDRLKVLDNLKKIIGSESKIIMTNWALNSGKNIEKYSNMKIKNSKNELGGEDFDVKIGENHRYYHAFSLEELEFLFCKSEFKIVENRLFDNQRNYISIIQKNEFTGD